MSAKENISHKDAAIPSVVPSESTAVRVMSQEDTLISDLIKEQPTLEQIASMKVKTRHVQNLLEFPEEVLERQDKDNHYVWLGKDKELAVKLRTSGWILCNRTNSPFIKPHRFGGHGAVEQAGMLLAFMPIALSTDLYMRPVLQSKAKVKHYTEDIYKNQDPEAGAQFYKPVEQD